MSPILQKILDSVKTTPNAERPPKALKSLKPDISFFGGLSAFQSERSQKQFFFQPCSHFLAENSDSITVFTRK